MRSHPRAARAARIAIFALVGFVLVGGFTLGLARVTGHLVPFHDFAFHRAPADARYRDLPFTGIAYEFYPGGGGLYRLSFYRRGLQTWKEFHWYAEGGRWVENDWSRGVPHGDFRMWYEDGGVKAIQRYANGVRDGESWSWHPTGSVSEFRRHDLGQEVAFKSWTPDGKPSANTVTQAGTPVGMRGGSYCKKRKPAGR